jgi:hypothetical protein
MNEPTPLPLSRLQDSSLPLPVVTGAIGLLAGAALPGGLRGGGGFIVGLVAGGVLVALSSWRTRVAGAEAVSAALGQTVTTTQAQAVAVQTRG